MMAPHCHAFLYLELLHRENIFLLDCEQSLFFAKLLHAKPNQASGEAACREKRGRKPEKKKIRDC